MHVAIIVSGATNINWSAGGYPKILRQIFASRMKMWVEYFPYISIWGFYVDFQ
jgi:hypothetical protein